MVAHVISLDYECTMNICIDCIFSRCNGEMHNPGGKMNKNAHYVSAKTMLTSETSNLYLFLLVSTT